MAVKEYLLQNWALILVLVAYAISLFLTIFLDNKVKRRSLILIIVIFLLSIVVFAEFYNAGDPSKNSLRTFLMSIRYSATPFIAALVIFTLIKRQRWFIFIPAIVLFIVDFISIFTGIVFSLDANGDLIRGPLGYLPFIVAGLYLLFLVFIMVRRSNKRADEIIPIAFLAFAFVAGLALPFILGTNFAHLFCTTIAIALFVYHEFSIHEITKKDPLTGLLNRQAYYADVSNDPVSISALLSIDMNGLKTINDNEGHAAGDDALITLAICFKRALKRHQSGYRIGGDEFVIVCRKNNREEVQALIKRIEEAVSRTRYTCSIGYSFKGGDEKTIARMLKESDEMMYEAKARHYEQSGIDRRTH